MFAELLRQRLGSIIELSPFQIKQLQQHFDLLNRWNKVFNLTGIRKPVEIVERHYCESLFLGKHLPSGTLRIADVGSGAGFPGIPVAVLRPDCSVTLIESHQRKSVFLREATRQLSNVQVVAKRVEQLADEYDWAVSRAVRLFKIEKAISKIAERAAILSGRDQPSGKCFTWNIPILVPWGTQRYLWLGSRCST